MKQYFIQYPGNTLKLDKKKQYFIGRNKDCEIYLSHQSVSRQHAVINWQKQGFVITDKGSKNGTILNTTGIRSQVMRDKDKIRIGVYYLEYRIAESGNPTDAPPKVSDTMLIENKVGEIIEQIDDPGLSAKIMGLKHIINLEREKLSSLAYIDKLTNLYNRRYFDEQIAEEVERAARYNRELTVIMADIDHFKQYNDTYGHQQGDNVLRTVAAIIKSTLRKSDIPARYGGEEFCIILPETSLMHGAALAEKIRLNVALAIGKVNGMAGTISLGVACYSPVYSSAMELIKAADEALYRAKARGRNRCELARI